MSHLYDSTFHIIFTLLSGKHISGLQREHSMDVNALQCAVLICRLSSAELNLACSVEEFCSTHLFGCQGQSSAVKSSIQDELLHQNNQEPLIHAARLPPVRVSFNMNIIKFAWIFLCAPCLMYPERWRMTGDGIQLLIKDEIPPPFAEMYF